MIAKEPVEIYTVGHGSSAGSDFIDLLLKYDVRVIVDVRSSPYSRYVPQYNRDSMAEMLAEVGIEYVFAGEYLGGRPQDPTCYKHGSVPTGKAAHLKLVDYHEVSRRPWYLKGIDRLVQIAQEKQVAIMCSEEDPHHCHRYHLITPTLAAQGLKVTHLRHKADTAAEETEPQQLTMF